MLKKLTIVSAVALVLFACEKQQFIVNPKSTVMQMPSNPTYQETDHQFFWGLFPTSQHNISQICPQGADIIGTKKTFLNGFLGSITSGIYTPRTYQVQCSAK